MATKGEKAFVKKVHQDRKRAEQRKRQQEKMEKVLYGIMIMKQKR